LNDKELLIMERIISLVLNGAIEKVRKKDIKRLNKTKTIYLNKL